MNIHSYIAGRCPLASTNAQRPVSQSAAVTAMALFVRRKEKVKNADVYPLYLSLEATQFEADSPLPHINLTWSNWRDADEFEKG